MPSARMESGSTTPRSAPLRWGALIYSFEIGPYVDGWRDHEHAARVFACRKLEGSDVLPYRSGRSRRLYLALAKVGIMWGVVGVYKSMRTAKREAQRVLPGEDSS